MPSSQSPAESYEAFMVRFRFRPWAEELLDRVVLTPACGLAGWTPAAVSAVLRALRTTAERMDEELSR